MFLRCFKILLAVLLSLMFTISLMKLVFVLWENFFILSNDLESEKFNVNIWLDENNLSQYKNLFKEKGKFKMFL